MNKKQSIFLKLENPVYFLTLLILVITIFFVVLSPRISSLLFPQKREMSLNSFLSKTEANKSIDSQEFWQFREFYSPGYFELKDQGLNDSSIKSALMEMGITPKGVIYTSLFRSRNSTSLDGLTLNDSLSETVSIDSNEKIFENDNSVIFKSNDKTFIIFLLPISEMKKANGFFEYDGKDRKFLENKYWFNITEIKG